jgi:hypothetical protein
VWGHPRASARPWPSPTSCTGTLRLRRSPGSVCPPRTCARWLFRMTPPTRALPRQQGFEFLCHPCCAGAWGVIRSATQTKSMFSGATDRSHAAPPDWALCRLRCGGAGASPANRLLRNHTPRDESHVRVSRVAGHRLGGDRSSTSRARMAPPQRTRTRHLATRKRAKPPCTSHPSDPAAFPCLLNVRTRIRPAVPCESMFPG